jgi:exopolysaccharide production protein ExoZ
MLKNIQTLRFFAALLVLLHHMQPPLVPFTFTLLPQAITKFGFAGVDLFFVISGLIIGETTRNMAPGWKTSARFLSQRFGRIYIIYWPFLALYILGAWYLNLLSPQKSLWGSFFLWPQDFEKYLLPIAWTLSFELYFYVCISLIILWNRRHAALILGCCGFFILIINTWFYFRGIYLPINEALAKRTLLIPFYLSPLVLEFIAGFLLSEWLNRHPKQNLGYWFVGAGAFLIAAYMYQTTGNLHASGMAGFFHVSERVLLIGSFSCCVVVCAMELERRKITPWPIVQALGNSSYSIYLTHILFIALMGMLYSRVPHAMQLPAFFGLLTITLILGFSWFFYPKFSIRTSRRLA